MSCRFKNCARVVYAKEMCRKHYTREWVKRQGEEFRAARSAYGKARRKTQSVEAKAKQREYHQAWRAKQSKAAKSSASAYMKKYTLARIARMSTDELSAYRERRRAYQAKWRATRLEELRESDKYGQRYLRNYGLTKAVYVAMLEDQGGRCAVCGALPKRKRLAVDHDHITGKVRGLLCDRCNHGIGHLGDDPARCRSAADYLTFFRG